MTARYKRLILGLLVFLGMMLLIGRVRIDTSSEPPLPSEGQAQQAISRMQEAQAAEQRRNPYRYNPVAHAACADPQTADALQELRRQRDEINNAIRFADAGDHSGQGPLRDIAAAMRKRTFPECLHRARLARQDAINSAQGELLAHQDSDINPFELREKMQGVMRYRLENAEKEFGLADEALQHP